MKATPAKSIEFIEDPAQLDDMLEAISCGTTMLEWCEEKEIRYGSVCRAMSTPERKKRLDAAREMRDELLTDMVIRNLREFADVKLKDAYDSDGNLLPLSDMPEGLQRAITGVTVTSSVIGTGDTASIQTVTKIHTVKPEKVLELLGKYRKMFVDRSEVTGPGGGPIPIVYLPDNHRDGGEVNV